MSKNTCWVFACTVTLCLLVVVIPTLMAQTASTGAIRGTVTDSSGAVVPNVTVTATNAGTGQSRTATTGSDGSYSLPLLPLGIYTVKFEASGFNTESVPSITTNVSETTVLNRALAVGSQTQ